MESVVAQRIKSVLEDKQISIAAFAKRIGMQQVTCNRQIRGDQAVSLGLIEGFLLEFHNISAEWLLRGKGGKLIREETSVATELESIHVQNKNDLQADSIWKAKYDELEKRYNQLLSILGGRQSPSYHSLSDVG